MKRMQAYRFQLLPVFVVKNFFLEAMPIGWPHKIFSTEAWDFRIKKNVVHSEGLEPPTPWFEAKYSIQLSYECMVGRIGFEPMTQRLKAFCSTD
jgi:hypothetical protein